MIGLVGILALLSSTSAQLPTNLYVNFIPNQVEETCKGDTAVGVGYSFSINQCIVVEDKSYYFIVDALRAGWKIYNNTDCKGKFDVGSYKNGSCVLADFASDLPTQWAIMYISESPVPTPITTNSTFITSYYTDDKCTNLQYYYYFVTGFQYTYMDYNLTFSCDSSQSPVESICTSGCTGEKCCTSKQYPTTCSQETTFTSAWETSISSIQKSVDLNEPTTTGTKRLYLYPSTIPSKDKRNIEEWNTNNNKIWLASCRYRMSAINIASKISPRVGSSILWSSLIDIFSHDTSVNSGCLTTSSFSRMAEDQSAIPLQNLNNEDGAGNQNQNGNQNQMSFIVKDSPVVVGQNSNSSITSPTTTIQGDQLFLPAISNNAASTNNSTQGLLSGTQQGQASNSININSSMSSMRNGLYYDTNDSLHSAVQNSNISSSTPYLDYSTKTSVDEMVHFLPPPPTHTVPVFKQYWTYPVASSIHHHHEVFIRNPVSVASIVFSKLGLHIFMSLFMVFPSIERFAVSLIPSKLLAWAERFQSDDKNDDYDEDEKISEKNEFDKMYLEKDNSYCKLHSSATDLWFSMFSDLLAVIMSFTVYTLVAYSVIWLILNYIIKPLDLKKVIDLVSVNWFPLNHFYISCINMVMAYVIVVVALMPDLFYIPGFDLWSSTVS
ncbi:hypothetical protein DFA_06932 [Cavenderia fasciculata]|uniref:Uncharacterized protein n=1 Tax=Cavenderia fasciculata TaxID=261658 RepID=F4PX27_CACFS|nr:uncharacterized protein DFA_06932 [Cavenderia fasciculata]EGG19830.1 hypothetical protein DFA_06932 [Cavenderia fasciculata]|eukprot:XP_004358176.1 hypothetical protein DFA_06932 [Cavenderia fasciculata]